MIETMETHTRIVHEGDKSSGRREQQVDIHLNFIGQFAVPEEAEPDGDADEKRAMWRKYKRKQRERQKQSVQTGREKTA